MSRERTWRLAAGGITAFWGVCALGAGVTVDSVGRVWPWSHVVDVGYTVSMGDSAEVGEVSFAVVQDGVTNAVATGIAASAGTHVHRFDASAMGTNAFEVAVKLVCTPRDELAPDVFAGLDGDGVVRFVPGDYMVVDVSGGPAATSFPVTHLTHVTEPETFNTPEYKTTKIALRRIAPGRCRVGHYARNAGGEARLTQTYYAGVFPITQAQFENVMGYNPSEFTADAAGDPAAHRPVERVSWLAVRASSAFKTGSVYVLADPYGAEFNWPETNAVNAVRVARNLEPSASLDVTSFMGVMRSKTGLAFDLPTVTQWERAYFAGCPSDFYFDASYTAADDAVGRFMWYAGNSEGRTHAVGEKLPNAWGLYDMSGNVAEWQLNWAYRTVNRVSTTDAERRASYCGDDPGGLLFESSWLGSQTANTNGPRRERRGGTFGDTKASCAGGFLGNGLVPYAGGLYYRVGKDPVDDSTPGTGFRLFCAGSPWPTARVETTGMKSVVLASDLMIGVEQLRVAAISVASATVELTVELSVSSGEDASWIDADVLGSWVRESGSILVKAAETLPNLMDAACWNCLEIARGDVSMVAYDEATGAGVLKLTVPRMGDRSGFYRIDF